MTTLQFPYVHDLGNGFSKRKRLGDIQKDSLLDNPTDRDLVEVEPSFIAEILEDTTAMGGGTSLDIINVCDRPVYIGQDAIDSGLNPIPAVGDTTRYERIEYKEMLFGFIAKDIPGEEIKIPLQVLGLPVAHWQKKHTEVEQLATTQKIVHLNNKPVHIKVEKTLVLAQPMGTYSYLLGKGKIDNKAKIIIVDGGFGSLDITEMTGPKLTSYHGQNIGMNDAFTDIVRVLIREFGSLKTFQPHNIPNILTNGLKFDGETVDIRKVPEIEKILNAHFKKGFTFLEQRYSLQEYDYVVWTGGEFEEYAEKIVQLPNKNNLVLEHAQVINVLGYEMAGLAVM